jgi:hypothetical protein
MEDVGIVENVDAQCDQNKDVLVGVKLYDVEVAKYVY